MKQSAALSSWQINAVLLGVLLMLLGDFMFTLNDAMGKWLVTTYAVGQVVFVRSIGAFIVLAPMIVRQGGAAELLRVQAPVLQVLRVVLLTMDTVLFFAAVAYLPLADVLTFYMAAPIYIAALSHFMLGERVGWRRWLAIAVGFGGVVVALQPSSASLSWPAIFALGGSASFAFTMVLGRRLRGTSDTTLVTWQTAAALVTGAVMSVGTWQTPSLPEFAAMLLLGAVSCIAHLLITRSLKLAPASLLAPLQYSMLVWGIIFGYIFFGDVPAGHMLVGAAIIVLAGLFIFHRQSVVTGVPAETVPKDIV